MNNQSQSSCSRRGYTHIYTGNGKGKTTAAVGLAVRAAGAGLKVLFVQFVKGQETSELQSIRLLPNIEVRRSGSDSFIYDKPSKEDIAHAQELFTACADAVKSGEYDVVIMDEGITAASLNLLHIKDLCDLVHSRPTHIELVMTGHNAPAQLIEIADLVTEMREVKHYFRNNVPARLGIEF